MVQKDTGQCCWNETDRGALSSGVALRTLPWVPQEVPSNCRFQLSQTTPPPTTLPGHSCRGCSLLTPPAGSSGRGTLPGPTGQGQDIPEVASVLAWVPGRAAAAPWPCSLQSSGLLHGGTSAIPSGLTSSLSTASTLSTSQSAVARGRCLESGRWLSPPQRGRVRLCPSSRGVLRQNRLEGQTAAGGLEGRTAPAGCRDGPRVNRVRFEMKDVP